jgi:hypothetical protein
MSDALLAGIEQDSYDQVWAALTGDPSLASVQLGGSSKLPAELCAEKGAKSAELAAQEHAGVQQLREAKPDVQPLDARRFLRARQHDIAKASKFMEADLEWRASFKPENVSQSDIPTALATGSWRVLGMTDEKPLGGVYPVLWIQVAYWHPHLYSLEEYVKVRPPCSQLPRRTTLWSRSFPLHLSGACLARAVCTVRRLLL